MISKSVINAQGRNERGDFYMDYMLSVEYYTNGQGQAEEATRWGGKGAALLGLEGKPVTKEDMLALAAGFSPSGEALCRNAGAKPRQVVKTDRNGNPRLDKEGNPITKMEGGHRVGYDMTFSAPKSFSVAFALAQGEERDAILDCHRRAVAVGMRLFEQANETRRGAQGKNFIPVVACVYTQAEHFSSRDLDMNIHTHNLIYGVAMGADGKWGTYESRGMFRIRRMADMVYKNELAANMRELGYSIETGRELNDDQQETGQVHWKVAGISDELCKTFSKRREAILAYQAEHGVDAQTANLATRRHKEEPTYAEMTAMWKQTMEGLPEGMVPTTAQLKQQKDKLMEAKSDEEILEKLHENEAVFCDHELMAVLASEYAGRVRYPELVAMAEEFKQRAGLVHIQPEKIAEEDKGISLSRVHTETRYAARWMVEWEKEVVHRVESRKDEEHQKVPQAVVDKAIAAYEKRKKFQLSDEQRGAIRNLTSETGGVAILEGFAGTGKTTVSDVYSQAFRAQGRRMLGVAVSNAAAKKLEEESGMPCVSVSKMIGRLEKGRMSLTAKDVLVVDEAGMLDTNQTRKLLSHAHKGGAKVILQGDIYQLQAIGAGAGMSLAKRAEKGVKLTEVRRQARVEDRETAVSFYQRDEDGNFVDVEKGTRSRREALELGQGILKRLEARGAIDDYDTQPEAIKALVSDYLDCPKSADEKLVLGHARVEVAALNDGIRQGLKERGEIAKRDVQVRVKDNGFWSEIGLARGDRVRFTDSNQDLGVINGSQGVVLGIRDNPRSGGADIAVRLSSSKEGENGRVVKFNSADFPKLAHNFATTIHKSQGQGKEEVFHLANQGMMDNHSALVAFTRLTKGDYRLYGTVEDIERLAERFGMERLKGTALGEGLKEDLAAEAKQGQGKALNPVQAILQGQAAKAEHAEKVASNSLLSDAERAELAQAAGAFLKHQLQRRRQRTLEHGQSI